MNNATKAAGRLMIVAAAVFGAFAQEQPARSQVRGGMTRSSMYLRLFREIADFEARADAGEAKGVTPSKLRNYHQWRMGLSPVRGTQLRDAALECLKGLKSEGLMSEDGGSPGGARVAGRTERIMERVGAGVDSLAAAMGPAEFAYLDSLVRRYMATPTLGSEHRGLPTVAGGAALAAPVSIAPPVGQTAPLASAKKEPVAACATGGGGGGDCPLPTDETIGYSMEQAVAPNTSLGYAIGGKFSPTLSPYADYSGRTVSEAVFGQWDNCHFAGSAMGEAPAPAWGSWPVGGGGTYGPDWILTSWDWAQYYATMMVQGVIPEGCDEGVYQVLYIDQCGPSPVAYSQGGDAGNFLQAVEDQLWVSTWRSSGNGYVQQTQSYTQTQY